MHILTAHNNSYSYLRQTNEIVSGIVEDDTHVWEFAPYMDFSTMPEVYMFVIALTEQCNLRCVYCCYSGDYLGNHIHNDHSLCEGDIEKIYSFIVKTAADKPIHISFYGGEPLLRYDLIQYAVELGIHKWGDRVTFAVSTNGTLLSEERIDWLVNNGIEMAVSIDGTASFHDRYRIDSKGRGTFAKVYHALDYLHNHTFKKEPQVVLLLTLTAIADVEFIAKEWHSDKLLQHYPPTHISGLTPNFSKGVVQDSWGSLSSLYLHLIDVYQQHPKWGVLQTFFNEIIGIWKERSIFKVVGEALLPTCMPLNTRLYIDAHLQVAVCEKMDDRFRIGTIENGIDWKRANELAKEYYNIRQKRCATCSVVRMCNQCLQSVTYNDEQWDVLCHNERLNHKIGLLSFCELAERGMLQQSSVVPKLHTKRCLLNAVNENDMPSLRVIFSDESTQRYLPELCEIASTDDGVKRILNSFDRYLQKQQGVIWAIRQDYSLIGFVAIMDIPEYSTIFYAMASEYRGNGIMTECVAEVVGWFKRTYREHRLYTEVFKDNLSSIAILKCCGFQKYKEIQGKTFMMLGRLG